MSKNNHETTRPGQEIEEELDDKRVTQGLGAFAEWSAAHTDQYMHGEDDDFPVTAPKEFSPSGSPYDNDGEY